jgi:two-component system nitrogen regulation sensor histidine kinase GlnL
MINLPGVVSMIAAIASLLLAIVVYLRAPDRALGRVFALLALALVSWNLNFVVLYTIKDYQWAFLLAWLFRTGAVFLLPAILHLCLLLPGRTLSTTWRFVLLIDYGLAVTLAFLNCLGLLVERLEAFEWGYHSVGSRYYNLFALLVAINFVLSLVVLTREYITTSEPRMRLQLKFWLLGIAVALPLGITNLLPSYGVPFYPLGNLGSAAWAALVGYAIVRYRLMDVELVVTRALAYLCAIAGLIVPTLLLTTLLQELAFGEVHYDFSVALAVLFTAVGIGFSTLRTYVETALENILFPAKVESRRRLEALGSEAVRILNRDRLLDLLSESVSGAFGVERLALYLRGESRPGFDLERVVGPAPTLVELPGDAPIARWLRKAGEAVIREEAVAADPRGGAGQLGQMLAENGWEACVPFVGGRELLGFLGLGRKQGLQAYSAGDLDLLSRVAAEASIALQNARLYEELRRSREVINRASRLSAIGTLAAGIAHEIRNPLVSIQTFFQLAPQRLNDEEFMTSFLSLAENEVQRIGSLVTELLTFAKSPSATIREVDINEIVERVVTLLAPQATTSRIALGSRLSQTAGKVLGDGDQLMQVVLNLSLNALQATPENGQVTIETRDALHDGELYCEICVTDSGAGIPSEIKDSIFDPFFTTKDKGSGLGLAICHQVVLECGGFMSVESIEGKGSTFRVCLPALSMEGVRESGHAGGEKSSLQGRA